MRAVCWILSVANLITPQALVGEEPRFVMEYQDEQAVEAILSYSIQTRQFHAERWQLVVPQPPELPGQTDIKVTTKPTSRMLVDKSPITRPLRIFDLGVTHAASARLIDVEMVIQAKLHKRALVPLREGIKTAVIPPLRDAERKFYLASSTLVDHEATLFREWLDKHQLRRMRGENERAFAVRVLEQIRTQFDYGYTPGLDQRASLACTRQRTDCGGMAFMFVGALRANGIPARSLIGRMAQSRQPGTRPGDLQYDNPHVRSEFFVPEIGWVPVDPTLAKADLTQPVSDITGQDPGDFIVLHVDVDLLIPFRERNESAIHLQVSPFYRVFGRGTLDASLTNSSWHVRNLK